jgi:hypothetical protein
MLASLAPPGSPDVDILVLSSDQTVVASLQVKTRTYGPDQGWHMSEKHEEIVEDRLFYTFLNLGSRASDDLHRPKQDGVGGRYKISSTLAGNPRKRGAGP